MENENTKKPMTQGTMALNYGFLIAVGVIILTMVMYLTNTMGNIWVSSVSFLILLAGIVMGILKYRDDYNGGYISYGRALGLGSFMSFFSGVFAGIFVFVFYNYIAPDALENLRHTAEMNMLELNPNASDQELQLASRFVSPLLMLIGTIFSNSFYGFLLSLIAAAFLKKKEPLDLDAV